MDGNSKYFRARLVPCSLAETQTGWRSSANQGEISPEDRSLFLIETLCAAPLARRCPVRGPLPALSGSAPAAKYIYIDAFNGKYVTRETLLRYTFKSHSVNILIGGKLWKRLGPGARAGFSFHFERNEGPFFDLRGLGLL
jgi:hypothetical protein